MKDSALRLQDKTLLLVGPFAGITQAILRTMTEFGADIGFVNENFPNAVKYVDAINEARDIHPEYGRAAYYQLPLKTEAQIQEALGKITESLGRIDAVVDATPLAWNATTDAESSASTCRNLAEKSIPFFMAKQRGRIVYLLEDPSLDNLVKDGPPTAACREALSALMTELAVKHRAHNITINALSVGITDDFLLKNQPKSPSLKRAFEELQKSHPGIKLVEFHDVGLGTAYLTSALSASLTGQVLHLTHGHHL